MRSYIPVFLALSWAVALIGQPSPKTGDAALGTQAYEKYEDPRICGACHVDIARQHEQAMMAQAFIHPWDEIEYFELAVPHAAKEPKVAGVKAGCNGCHAPLAFLAGDIPPRRPNADTRANEAVSCDLCHTLTGFQGDTPFNFNWISRPGKTKQGPRAITVKNPYHETAENAFLRSADYCGTCHNEKDPYGQWVKATHLEWKDGPQAKAGIVCQDCHMPPSLGKSTGTGESHADVHQHLFHGAHDLGKLTGSAEVRIHPLVREADPEQTMKFTAVVVNAKAGHKIPTGSAEERVVWLDVTVRDGKGKIWRLPVDRKGFEGEDWTIASDSALAYQDIGETKGIAGFKGLKRDGVVPAGDRIFRMPYLDPKGRMTVQQWYTASFGPDYRLAPLKAVKETYTWKLPADAAPGPLTVTARIYYSRLVASVAEYMKVPKDEYEPVLVNEHTSTFNLVE